MNLFNNYQAYDIVKNMAGTCLKDYDSYFISFYKLNNPTNQSEYYYVYCGNLEGEEGSYYFNGYRQYSISYKPGDETFNIGFSSSTGRKNISDFDVASYEHFTNIPFYNSKYADILATSNQEITVEGGSNSSVEFPFTQEQFIAIPFLLCILILMLFLKWCFPMKGGKDLK